MKKVKKRDKQRIYIERYIKGVIAENKEIYLCFSGNTTEAKYDLSNIDQINTYNFTLKYEPHHAGSARSYHMYVKQKNIIDGCDSHPQGQNILSVDNTFKGFARYSEQIEFIEQTFPNKSIFVLDKESNTKNIYEIINLYISLGEDVPHNNERLYTEYFIENSECYLCYAGFPFAVIFDIITFPIQIIWFLLSSGH